jgi:hypothetical protein
MMGLMLVLLMGVKVGVVHIEDGIIVDGAAGASNSYIHTWYY